MEAYSVNKTKGVNEYWLLQEDERMNRELDYSADLNDDCAEIGISDLTAYTLNDDESRREFLFTFYWLGGTALFAAVSHVWDRLAEPREWRCTQIGQLSGTGGQGKAALLLTLQKLLAEALETNSPLPSRDEFETLSGWHDAVMQSFAADEAAARKVCDNYAQILDGGLCR